MRRIATFLLLLLVAAPVSAQKLSTLTAGVVLDLQLDTTWQQPAGPSDRGGMQAHGTVTGSPVVGAFGTDFDGAADFVTISDNAAHRFTETDAFSMTVWFNGQSDGGPSEIMEKRGAGGDRYIILLAAGNTLSGQVSDGSNTLATGGAANLNDGNWHHAALTYNGSNLLTVYIDGVSVGTDASPTLSGVDTTGGDTFVGKGFNGFFNGEAAKALIHERELSAGEVLLMASQRIGGDHKLSSLTAGLVLDLPLDLTWQQPGGLSDRSATHSHGTITGSPVIGAFGTTFDGAADFVTIADNAAHRFDENDAFSMTIWFNGSDDGAATEMLEKRFGSDRYMLLYNTGNFFGGQVGDGVNTLSLFGVVDLDDGNWHHGAMTYDGANTMTVYVDGASIGTDTSPTLSGLDTSGADVRIGRGNNGFFVGELAKALIHERELSAAEILLMASQRIGGDHKLSPLTVDQVLDMPLNLTWQQPGGLSDRSVVHSHGTITGAPVVGAFGVDFDGSTDFLTTIDDDRLSHGDAVTDTPFSVTAWINMDVTSAVFPIVDKSSGTTVNEYAMWVDGTDSLSFFLFDNDDNNYIKSLQNGTLTALANTWVHVGVSYSAVTQTNADFTMYVGGVSVAETGSEVGTYVGTHNHTAPLLVAKRKSFNDQFANGEIARAKIHRRALSAAEMLLLASQRITDL